MSIGAAKPCTADDALALVMAFFSRSSACNWLITPEKHAIERHFYSTLSQICSSTIENAAAAANSLVKTRWFLPYVVQALEDAAEGAVIAARLVLMLLTCSPLTHSTFIEYPRFIEVLVCVASCSDVLLRAPCVASLQALSFGPCRAAFSNAAAGLPVVPLILACYNTPSLRNGIRCILDALLETAKGRATCAAEASSLTPLLVGTEIGRKFEDCVLQLEK